ncbi:MAG: hypothetical protein ABI376_05840 [Caulobacteraceae bacterium]
MTTDQRPHRSTAGGGQTVHRPNGASDDFPPGATFEVRDACLIVTDRGVLQAIYAPGEWKSVNQP